MDFAASSVSLRKGGVEEVVDLLITNHSEEPVERVHLVYPHAIPATMAAGTSPSFADISDSLLDQDSPYNELYPTSVKWQPEVAGWRLILTTPDPSDIRRSLDYWGYVRGGQMLLPYEVADGEGLSRDEWKILSGLGWSVFTLTFESPIANSEARWLRFYGKSGTLAQNVSSPIERAGRLMLGLLTDQFEIVGPRDIHHRILTALQAARSLSEN